MKKMLFDENGKPKIISYVLLGVVVISVTGLLYFFLVLNKKINTSYGLNDSNVNTTTIKLCNNCSFKFIKDVITIKTGSTNELEQYLKLKNVSLYNLKFEVEDEDIVQIKSFNGKITLNGMKKVGKTKIKAVFDDKTTEVLVNVEAGEIESVKLSDKPYYIYLGKQNDIKIETIPEGVELNDVHLVIDDESIASLDGNKVIGNNLGTTKIHLFFKEDEYIQDIIVVKNLIKTELNNSGSYEEVDSINVTKGGTYDILVTIEDNDNQGFNNDSIRIEKDEENMESIVEYDGVSFTNKNSFHYKISITTSDLSGRSNITFILPDDSKKTISFIKEPKEKPVEIE